MSDEPFPGSAADFYERIQVLKEQFRKAEDWNKLAEIQIKNLQEIVASQNTLIIELADALEWYKVQTDRSYEFSDQLIQKAREAVK